jgi:hypothetical protein
MGNASFTSSRQLGHVKGLNWYLSERRRFSFAESQAREEVWEKADRMGGRQGFQIHGA